MPVVNLTYSMKVLRMHGLHTRDTFENLWNGFALASKSTQAYTFEKNCCILLRQKFGDQ
jgi:hypothetical protein